MCKVEALNLLLAKEPLPKDHPFRDTFVCDDALTCESKVEWENYTHQKKSVAWFNPDMCMHYGLKHIVRMFKPNGHEKLKNLDKQLAR
eukprot:jgi/Tetstr1/463027/TSEL_007965.t1